MKMYNYAAQEVKKDLRLPKRHSDHHRQKL